MSVASLKIELAECRAEVARLTRALADCQGTPVPEPTPGPMPVPEPEPAPILPGPQPSDIPPGTDVDPVNLAAALINGTNGQVFRVRPGSVANASLKLKPGQQIWGLDPTNMPWFKGPNLASNATPFAAGAGSAPDTVFAYLRVSGYHPAAPTWRGVPGNDTATMRRPAIDANNLPSARLYRLEMFENGMAIKLGDGMEVEECYLHHNHQYGLKGNTDTNWRVSGGEHSYQNYTGWFDWNIGASNKFVSDANGVIEDLFTHHNNGPGVWFDSGGNNVIIRRVRAEDNAGPGFFWEICNGWCIIENCTAYRNGGASNIYISSSKGTASNPITVRNNVTKDHREGREIRMLGNGSRAPGLGYVSILNNTCANVKLALSNGHPQPVGIVVTGNKNAAGQPVGLT